MGGGKVGEIQEKVINTQPSLSLNNAVRILDSRVRVVNKVWLLQQRGVRGAEPTVLGHGI